MLAKKVHFVESTNLLNRVCLLTSLQCLFLNALTGNMSMGPPGQQQQPRPGGAQFMQQRAPFSGVAPQRYPMMQQGMVPQQGAFPPQMYGGQVPVQVGEQHSSSNVPRELSLENCLFVNGGLAV